MAYTTAKVLGNHHHLLKTQTHLTCHAAYLLIIRLMDSELHMRYKSEDVDEMKF